MNFGTLVLWSKRPRNFQGKKSSWCSISVTMEDWDYCMTYLLVHFMHIYIGLAIVVIITPDSIIAWRLISMAKPVARALSLS